FAVAGPAESGKSTTAAALARFGYAVLSDDIVTLAERRGTFLVRPAYPRIRLWPDAAEALYGFSSALPQLTPNWDKCYLDLTRNGYRFQPSALPLAAIYLLGERVSDAPTPRVERLEPRSAFMSLIANSYASRLMDAGMRAREFDLLGRLVAAIPVKRVVPRADLGGLTRLCTAIVEAFGRAAPAVHGFPAG